MEVTRTPQRACLFCKKPLNSASHLKEGTPPPSEGDFTICLYCGHLMVFGSGMDLRDPTDSEIKEIAGRPDLIEIQKFAKLFRDRREREAKNG